MDNVSPPSYRWTCQRCDAANEAGHSQCTACGFPAAFQGSELRSARRLPVDQQPEDWDRMIPFIVFGAIFLMVTALPSAVRTWNGWTTIEPSLLCIGLSAFVVEPLVFRRLRAKHLSTFETLGSPQFGHSNLTSSAGKRVKFLYAFRFLSLRDWTLSTLCFAAMIGEVCLLLCLVAGYHFEYSSQ